MKAVEQGVVNNTTNKRMIELENRLENIERQIIIEKSKTNFKLTKEDIVTYLNDALKLETQLLINYIVNQIILFDEKCKFILIAHHFQQMTQQKFHLRQRIINSHI